MSGEVPGLPIISGPAPLYPASYPLSQNGMDSSQIPAPFPSLEPATVSMLANTNGTNGQGSLTDNKWSKNGFGQSCPRAPLNGKFSPEESLLVRASIQQYCQSHNISPGRLCSECDHKAELKGAWMEIARALPHRTVQSVYRHGLRQLHPFQRGPWSDEECSRLYELVQTLGKKWSTIQSKLNRSADSCRDKYREMSRDYIKGRWKEEETKLLLRLVSEFLKLPPMSQSDAQNAMAAVAAVEAASCFSCPRGPPSTQSKLPLEMAAEVKRINDKCEAEQITIPWSVISKRMVNRSRLSCFRKWENMSGKGGGDEDDEDDEDDGDEDGGDEDGGDEDVRPLPLARPGSSAVSLFQVLQQQNVVKYPALDAPPKVVRSRRGNKRDRKKPDAIEGNTGSQSISSQPQIWVQKEDEASSDFASGPFRDTTFKKSRPVKKSKVLTELPSPKITNGRDVQLLQQLASTQAARPTDVDWAGLSHPRAFARWSEILDDAERMDDTDKVLDMPLAAQAGMLLERCTGAGRGDFNLQVSGKSAHV
eukprot:CAMPEP_0195509940 /NCGR_PEP_ID=MMETSP0794_2-20130614/2727_1 /TAXON_ID=515487 /ORGANISM="Stephanopyxis turris, Strain CCMP 815" /LENGTH=534 /DNA_ID=CAMNT_0040637275 /DNA_START=48 /DNA_END=1652 /DNA_ORIENTATION=+